MVQKGYYPRGDERLRGTFIVSPIQDVLPLFLNTADTTFSANVRTQNYAWFDLLSLAGGLDFAPVCPRFGRG